MIKNKSQKILVFTIITLLMLVSINTLTNDLVFARHSRVPHVHSKLKDGYKVFNRPEWPDPVVMLWGFYRRLGCINPEEIVGFDINQFTVIIGSFRGEEYSNGIAGDFINNTREKNIIFGHHVGISQWFPDAKKELDEMIKDVKEKYPESQWKTEWKNRWQKFLENSMIKYLDPEGEYGRYVSGGFDAIAIDELCPIYMNDVDGEKNWYNGTYLNNSLALAFRDALANISSKYPNQYIIVAGPPYPLFTQEYVNNFKPDYNIPCYNHYELAINATEKYANCYFHEIYIPEKCWYSNHPKANKDIFSEFYKCIFSENPKPELAKKTIFGLLIYQKGEWLVDCDVGMSLANFIDVQINEIRDPCNYSKMMNGIGFWSGSGCADEPYIGRTVSALVEHYYTNGEEKRVYPNENLAETNLLEDGSFEDCESHWPNWKLEGKDISFCNYYVDLEVDPEYHTYTDHFFDEVDTYKYRLLRMPPRAEEEFAELYESQWYKDNREQLNRTGLYHESKEFYFQRVNNQVQFEGRFPGYIDFGQYFVRTQKPVDSYNLIKQDITIDSDQRGSRIYHICFYAFSNKGAANVKVKVYPANNPNDILYQYNEELLIELKEGYQIWNVIPSYDLDGNDYGKSFFYIPEDITRITVELTDEDNKENTEIFWDFIQIEEVCIEDFDNHNFTYVFGYDEAFKGKILSDFSLVNGWENNNEYPRITADVNGNNRDDIVGFGEDGVHLSLAKDEDIGFEPSSLVLNDFGKQQGYTNNNEYLRIMADIHQDGRADIVAFGDNGVEVAPSTGIGFLPPYIACEEFGYNLGWRNNSKWPRMMADVTGDGMPDIIGFHNSGVSVGINQRRWAFRYFKYLVDIPFFGQQQGWENNVDCPRILADINGDRTADIIGINEDGMWYSLAILRYPNIDQIFTEPVHIKNCNEILNVWRNNEETPVRMGDVNGDGLADLVMFCEDGIHLALAKMLGRVNARVWPPVYFDYQGCVLEDCLCIDEGWTNSTEYPRLLGDVNNDGKADIVGFGTRDTKQHGLLCGVWVAKSTGTGFEEPGSRTNEYPNIINGFGKHPSQWQGWINNDCFPRMLADVNGDNKDDIVGFGTAGAYLGISQMYPGDL